MSKTPKTKSSWYEGIALWAAVFVHIVYLASAIWALVNYFQPKEKQE